MSQDPTDPYHGPSWPVLHQRPAPALFGQAWELRVKYVTAPDPDETEGKTFEYTISSNRMEPATLRITFEVNQYMTDNPWWTADITIWNLKLEDMSTILFNANYVTLLAGFVNGAYGVIWDGPVMQPMFDVENGVDQKVILRCIANPAGFAEVVSFSTGPFASMLTFVNRMAEEVNMPKFNFENGTVGPAALAELSARKFPRGYGAFGKVPKYLHQVSDSVFMQAWHNSEKAFISEVKKTDYTPQMIFAPRDRSGRPPEKGVTDSLIGTPRQTPQGATFTVLLDPRIKVAVPPIVVELQRTVVQQIPLTPSENINDDNVPGILNSMKYIVAAVRHVGDSRGNEWHTEVTGVQTTYAENLLDGLYAPTAGSPSGTR